MGASVGGPGWRSEYLVAVPCPCGGRVKMLINLAPWDDGGSTFVIDPLDADEHGSHSE